MPLQSGSDRVLKAMRRSYRSAKYLGIIDRVRAAMPDAAITTDIIVGFPGETEEDFAATLDVVRAARFAGAYTFQYSKRPGTPAATCPTRSPPDVVKDRYERLVELVNDIAWSENKALVGRRVELMVSEGEGRKDAATHRLSGRGPDNRLVHFAPPAHAEVRPGDLVTVEITKAAPHHLVADGPVLDVRRTRSGDAWELRQGVARRAGRCGAGHARRRRARSARRRAGLLLMAADAPTILATSGGIVYGSRTRWSVGPLTDVRRRAGRRDRPRAEGLLPRQRRAATTRRASATSTTWRRSRASTARTCSCS